MQHAVRTTLTALTVTLALTGCGAEEPAAGPPPDPTVAPTATGSGDPLGGTGGGICAPVLRFEGREYVVSGSLDPRTSREGDPGKPLGTGVVPACGQAPEKRVRVYAVPGADPTREVHAPDAYTADARLLVRSGG